MAIDGVGNKTAYLAQNLLNMRQQMEVLQQQLATGRKASTYAGMGVDRGFAIGLRSQLSAISSWSDTITNVDARINIATQALSRMDKLGADVKSAALQNTLTLDADGQTPGQKTAMASVAEMLQLLNTRAGDRYLFSGRATDTPAVATLDEIFNGSGARAGLKQIVDERRQADLGASGLGRLVLTLPTATSVNIAEDAAGSPFGLKLASASATLSGATLTGPAGAPPAISVDLGAVNPNAGEKLQLNFTLPEGTSASIMLTATSANPPGAGEFTIGADTTATTANLQTALNTAIGKLANTDLVAASAFAASDNFFHAVPPLRVAGPPFDSATALVAGTPADTVQWYVGESGSDPARGTAVARVDQSIAISYGMRASEDGIRVLLQNLAVFAAVGTNPSDPNAGGQVSALNTRMAANVSDQPGVQSIQNIEAELAGSQVAMNAARDRHVQTQSIVQGMLDGIEGVSTEEIAAKILAMQTSLQASYQTTAMLYQNSLVNYL